MKNIEKEYTLTISNYIHKRFKNINIIDISYEFNEVTFNIIVDLAINHDEIVIRLDRNNYGEDEFNKDYIKLKIFHNIKDTILNKYIEGDHNYYE